MKYFMEITLIIFSFLANIHAAESHPEQVFESVAPQIFSITPQDLTVLQDGLDRVFPNNPRVREILDSSAQEVLRLNRLRLNQMNAENFVQEVVKIADQTAQKLAQHGINIEELQMLTSNPLLIKIIDRLQELNLKDNKGIRVKTYFYAYSNLLIFIAVYVCFIKLLIESGNFKN